MSETATTLRITQAEFKDMIKLANAGDQSALTRLRETLDGYPSLWQRVGRLAIDCQLLLIQQTAGSNQLVEQSLTRIVEQMRSDLAGTEPTPLERVVLDQIVTCYLQAQAADKAVASDKGGTLPNGHYLLKRQGLAHRNFAQAIKSLLQIRKMLPKQRVDETRESNQPPNLLVFPSDDVPDSPDPALRPTGTC